MADRKILTLAHFNQDGAIFPDGYLMPLGFPKPSWGKWEVRDHAIADIHRIPSEAAGYCYSSRIIYADKEHWNGNWVDLYDSNHKLWKSIAYYNDAGNVAGLRRYVGRRLFDGDGFSESARDRSGLVSATRRSASLTWVLMRRKNTWTASSTAARAV